MTSTPAPTAYKIGNYLALLEKVLLAALAIGLVLTVMQIDSTVTAAALLALAPTFFLHAFRPPDLSIPENEPLGFAALIGLTIVPKLLWISLSISALAISFYLFEIAGDGYKQMLLIASAVISISTLLLLIFVLTGVKYIRLVAPVLLRALPFLAGSVFVLLKEGFEFAL